MGTMVMRTITRRTCNHGITFAMDEAEGLSAAEVRKRWPRFDGTCEQCGFYGVAYASFGHYVMGDW